MIKGKEKERRRNKKWGSKKRDWGSGEEERKERRKKGKWKERERRCGAR